MSDNTQPASSRRALREKRRAEMEALLASSEAEKKARSQAEESVKDETPEPKATEKNPDSAPKNETSAGPASEEQLGERASRRRARDREALRERRRLQEEVGALTSHQPTVAPADEPKPLTRRQLRLQALAEQGKAEAPKAQESKPAASSKKPEASDAEPETTVMSVEEALAARRAHGTTPPPIDPKLLGDDDSDIDLEVLAHQREMAARAAIISRRAAERERLRVENAKAGKDDESLSDPFTGAMGNIREAEERIARTGVSGPKTESVSLTVAGQEAKGVEKKTESSKPADKAQSERTESKDSTEAKSTAKPADKPAPKPAAKPAPKPAAKPAAPAPAAMKNTPAKPASDKGASNAKKPSAAPKQPAKAPAADKPAGKKQAAAPAAPRDIEMPRLEAVNAHGLDPLDVQTQGVRRANNMLITMIAALSVGGVALIAGIVMLINALS
ncbi:hypothetical protein [Glutamicibacter sp. PS]|uniref:hypothetical protein n=1 Tax=Glutamicibacter sp. PS TaxID=3075634 RepID=UPI00283CF82A|nr:hypothetical protein [Glutamicibacter sp. PS]MDR4532647.1 hypothetical protein [Glutamicibacter sp. PS]